MWELIWGLGDELGLRCTLGTEVVKWLREEVFFLS